MHQLIEFLFLETFFIYMSKITEYMYILKLFRPDRQQLMNASVPIGCQKTG